VKFHQNNPPQGIPSGRSFGSFYVDAAKELYGYLKPNEDGVTIAGILPFDVIMKEVQLRALSLPSTAILLDEAQDCNECQLAWVVGNRPQKFVAVVGDAVQTIYGFLGAKPRFMTNVPNCIDRTLTKSFRFGPNLACLANTILHVKQIAQPKDWLPYR
jgi:hypothetical protein